MKHVVAVVAVLLIAFLCYFSFFTLMPRSGTPASISKTEFSTERALKTLEKISRAPHYHGSEEHDRVQEVITSEMNSLNLNPQTQEGFVLNVENKGLNKPVNIVGRIKGSGNGKAVLLLSHYDSALVPSPGASDAGSGVVTILECIRTFKASGKTPENDIIVLFTDAEEIGLDGARLFVNEHPWAGNVGIVLNFEARGSGGPSNMILETNGGNENLIKAFVEANPEYPVASSLMYSVYKMLPNDTDSTVFREDGDIDSYFFAFIDDHFDYHTANDTLENLDVETLQHQGSYLLPLLTYFTNADLNSLKGNEDYVYVNFPFLKMISFPFLWILPLLMVAIVIFFILLFYGFTKGRLKAKDIGKGFLAFLVALVGCGAIGYFGWVLIFEIYPQYAEIQHGFKYNGHSYVAFFVFLSLAITFLAYRKLTKKSEAAGIFIAPIVFWLLINTAVFVYLKGAAYFIIPIFFGLFLLWLLIKQNRVSLLLFTFLAAPAIFLFAPLIQFFPVGLGSNMVVISCIFTVLLFGLLVPIFSFVKGKGFLSLLCFIVAIGFFIDAHSKSDFSEERQKPNSLIYYENADTKKAFWVTYDEILDDWTRGYLGENPQEASNYVSNASGSKYGTNYTYAAEAPFKNIEPFEVEIQQDSIINGEKNVTFTVFPKRKINQLNLYVDKNITFKSLKFNGKEVPKDSSGTVFSNRKNDLLLRYWVDNSDSLKVSYSTTHQQPIQFKALEFSYDLMDNPKFSIAKRPKYTMPKPFVVTDAVVVERTFSMEEVKPASTDSLKINPQNIEVNE